MDIERIKKSLAQLPVSAEQDTQFEIDMFLSRLELLEIKNLQSDTISNVDRLKIKSEMYEFLKEDLVDFLQKIIAEKNLPDSLPDLRPVHKDILKILKELGVYTYLRAGKNYEKSSIPERWLNLLIESDKLELNQIFNFFGIYRNRLYSLSENSPYGFGNQNELIRHIIRRDNHFNLSFVQIYRAELLLREQIMFALLRRFSPLNRLHYLVGKEMILNLSNEFMEALHIEGESYFKRLIKVQKRRHTYLHHDRNKIKNEMSQAAKFQNRNIQTKLPNDDARIEFIVDYQPFMELSGDFYRIMQSNKDEFNIFLGDIAGHGVGAAMYFNTVKNSFEKFSKYHSRPEKLLDRMDKHLYGKLDDNFLTAICLNINLKKKVLSYCNAGHPKAFFIMKGTGKNRIRFLRPNSKVLGVFKGAEYKLNQIKFDGSGRMVLYTDGISELFNEKNEMLGERGLLDIFKNMAGLDLKSTIKELNLSLSKFQGTKKTADDDRTMLIADIDLPIENE